MSSESVLIFKGGDLSSTYGYEALSKRNHDAKKMCQELEEYLKKRAKLEYEFSKSLSNLSKCFKYKEEIGNLEAALNQFKVELDTKSSSHHGAGVYFSKQADAIKTFKEDQTSKAKQAEDNLLKKQEAKLSQLSRTDQLEKNYKKKSFDREKAWKYLSEIDKERLPVKEIEKAKSKCTKAEEDAQKADSNYKAGVILLKNMTEEWEKALVDACQVTQELDVRRVKYLREEMWLCVNADSKLALDIDNCCEKVRQKLEKCDVMEDVNAFLKSASTGTVRPKHYTFKAYSFQSQDLDSDADSTTSSTDNYDEDCESKTGTLSKKSRLKGPKVFGTLKSQLKQ